MTPGEKRAGPMDKKVICTTVMEEIVTTIASKKNKTFNLKYYGY
jgi:hypothetical protein